MSTIQQSKANIVTDVNVQEHFRETIAAALANQQVEAEEDTVFYLVNLLAHFSKAEHLFEEDSNGMHLKPLALLYAQAMQADRLEERLRALRRLGDVALLISGVFSGYLNRRSVGMDYYIGMGSSAYSYLSENAHSSFRASVFNGIYAELSAKFKTFVDVLDEVGESSHLSSPGDVLRIYDIWAKTGSLRAANKLRKMGLEPLPHAGLGRQN